MEDNQCPHGCGQMTENTDIRYCTICDHEESIRPYNLEYLQKERRTAHKIRSELIKLIKHDEESRKEIMGIVMSMPGIRMEM